MTRFCTFALLLLAAAVLAADPGDTIPADSLMPVPPLDSALPPDIVSPPAFQTPVQVSIEQFEVTNMRLYDTLDVTLAAHGLPIAGYSLKIGVDDHRVQIVEILPGRFYDTCRWEYFTVRPLETTGRENYPRTVWKAVALAQFMPDSIQPLCYAVDGDISLLRLVVSNEHVRETDDGIIPIFFYWEDCSDNTLSDKSGNTLFLSRRVIDYSGAPPDSSAGVFPARTGAPRHCVDPAARNHPKRLVDFHNGAIEFRLDLTLPPDPPVAAPDSAAPDTP